MPKEVTHFIIAENVQRKLLEDPFWNDLSQYHNEIYLGSIFQDAFYFLPDYVDDNLIHLPDILHGAKEEDTFEIIKKYLYGYSDGKKIDMQTIAFLIGVISHIFTDATFHPLVYFYTGNYYDIDSNKRSKAIRDHRRIECLLDVIMAKNMDKVRSYQIDFFLSRIPNILHIFESILKEPFPQQYKEYSKKLLDSYIRYGKIRKVYTNNYLQSTWGFWDYLLHPKHKILVALAYNKRNLKYQVLLEDKVQFENPITGEQLFCTLEELTEIAISLTIEYCCDLKNYFLNGSTNVFHQIGPSLETNIKNSNVDNMLYFSKTPFFSIRVRK